MKDFLLAHQNDPAFAKHIALTFGKRSAEEIYNLFSDPNRLTNTTAAANPADTPDHLRTRVDDWIKQMNDPGVDHANDIRDKFTD